MEKIQTLLIEPRVAEAVSMRADLTSARPASFAIEHRRTLRSGVSRVRAGGLHVVLLDLELPDSSGVDAVARLHEAAPDLPIVALAPAEDEDLPMRALQACAEDCLVKDSADRRGLVRSIRNSIARHRSRAARAWSRPSVERMEACSRAVLANCSDGLAVVSRAGTVLFANPAAARILGRPIERLRGAMLGHPFTEGEKGRLSLDGGRVVEVHPVDGEWDGRPAWVVSLFDITEHERARVALERASSHLRTVNTDLQRLASIDPLTEAPNRRGLEAALNVEVRRRLRTGAPLAAILLDCDDFKLINEKHGHHGGDVALRELAERLTRSLRPSDHLGRIGGDEFLVLLPETRLAEASQVAERLRTAISQQPFPLSGERVRVTVSLGLALLPDDVVTIEDVLLRTGASLRGCKCAGKNRVSMQVDGSSDSMAS